VKKTLCTLIAALFFGCGSSQSARIPVECIPDNCYQGVLGYDEEDDFLISDGTVFPLAQGHLSSNCRAIENFLSGEQRWRCMSSSIRYDVILPVGRGREVAIMSDESPLYVFFDEAGHPVRALSGSPP